MKKLFFLVLLLFFGFLGWRIFGLVTAKKTSTEARQGRPPVAVELGKVEISSISDIRLFTGTINPINKYVVAPKISGRLVKITKRIGDHVERRETIAVIDDAEYLQDVREAEANLKIAQASLAESKSQSELASQELARVQSLQLKGIASSSELDATTTQNAALQSRLKVAQAQVDQRSAALTSARIRLGYTSLTTPEPGWIGERYVDEGQLLSANTPVVSVVGIQTVIIKANIIERDYGKIKAGQECKVEVDSYPGLTFTGKVSRIAPMLQENSRTAEMEVVVANNSLLLKPGMFARLNIVLTEKDSVQVIPNSALVSRNDVKGVFSYEEKEGKPVAVFIPVETGIISNEFTEIISPELSGDVITLGHHLIDNGSPLILPSVKESGEKTNPQADVEKKQ